MTLHHANLSPTAASPEPSGKNESRSSEPSYERKSPTFVLPGDPTGSHELLRMTSVPLWPVRAAAVKRADLVWPVEVEAHCPLAAAKWAPMLPHLVPFWLVFREQGLADTRTLTIRRYPGLPDDQYALTESYCPDPTCDRRWVMINVVGQRRMAEGFLASISFGFDRTGPFAGPYLDPINRQSRHANALFALVAQVLADAAYVQRLEAHYRQLKQAAVDQTSAAHRALLEILTDEERQGLEQAARSARGGRVTRWDTMDEPRRPGRPGGKKKRKG